ncbi:MAG: DMP19 family protein [Akkermansiaceae bacterium]
MPMTASVHDGLCAPCARDKAHRELEDQKKLLYQTYCKNPPKIKSDIDDILSKHDTEGNWFEMMLLSLLPPLINYSFVTKKGFDKAVQTIIASNTDDQEEIAGDFLYLCEPLLFKHDDLFKGLKKIPRPYRELIASYQYWGVISSDGLSSYVSQFTTKFDKEVSRGLLELGLNKTESTVHRARESWSEEEYSFGELDPDDLESEIFDEAGGFESLLASYLQKSVSA